MRCGVPMTGIHWRLSDPRGTPRREIRDARDSPSMTMGSLSRDGPAVDYRPARIARSVRAGGTAASGYDSYSARSGEHDDLLLPVWHASRPKQEAYVW
jgi:hypothetical protein